MPTLRDQLKARRSTYLERIAVFDSLTCQEPDDIRCVLTRGFLEGGDDVPLEWEAKGVTVERRRLPWLPQADKDAASSRLREPEKNEPSNEGDWDQFATINSDNRKDYNPGYNLYRLTTQLVRATEYFKKGVELPLHKVLEVRVSQLPQLTEKDETVPKAWSLLKLCGCAEDKLRLCYQHLINDIGPLQRDIDIALGLAATVSDWVGGFEGRFAVTDGQKIPDRTPLPPRAFDPRWPCQRKGLRFPDTTVSPLLTKLRFPGRTLDEALYSGADSIMAALDSGTAATVVEDFLFINTDPTLIAQIVLHFQDKWAEVPAVFRYGLAGAVWRAQHPDLRAAYESFAAWLSGPPGVIDEQWLTKNFLVSMLLDLQDMWEKEKKLLATLRAIPQFFMFLSQKNVGEVCGEILRRLWPDNDNPPYDKHHLDDSGITRGDYLGAIDRAVGRADCPFRLTALLEAPEGYMRVLDKLTPSANGPLADRFTPPEINPVNAMYWRVTVCRSTIGNILTMVDTADFHVTEHLRFLGLFRPGGKYRTGKPEDSDYENYISQFVPQWLIDYLTAALVRVKYWLDDSPLHRPNCEEMTYWSENHQNLFGSSEYILSAWFPSETFAYTNKPASWHHDRARNRVRAWLDHRLNLGFSELNSAVYYNQHLPPLFNLVDFAPDAEIQKKSRMVLDLMIFDIVRRVSQGSFVAASGRQYWGGKRSGWSVSIVSLIEVLTGLVGDQLSSDENSAASFVNSGYWEDIPECLLAIAHDTAAPRVDRSRTSINLSESKDYNIDPDSSAGIVEGTRVFVRQWACSDTGTDSRDEPVVAHSALKPVQVLEPLVNGALTVGVRDALPGAVVEVYAITGQTSEFFGSAGADSLHPVTIVGLIRALAVDDLIVATQQLCGRPSEPGKSARVGRPAGFGPRPFYVVGHNPNTIKQATDNVNESANGLEPDVQVYEDHPDQLCISHSTGESSAPTLVAYLDALHQLVVDNPHLALVVFDCKPEVTSPDHGFELLMAIRQHLTFDNDLNVIISIGNRKDNQGAFFDRIVDILGPREGLMIDAEDDPGAVSNYFTGRGVDHQGYGNGISFVNFVLGPYYRYTLEGACGIRAQAGRPRFIYVWTVNVHDELREYVRIGVDGAITDDVGDLRSIAAEAEFNPLIRLATRADNPFQPANFNYSLHIHTGDKWMAGTDANVTFTLIGSAASVSKTVNTDLIKRMESDDWNWVTIPSDDLGALQSITVQRDNKGNGPDWFLDQIEVHSARFGTGGLAVFNRWIDTTLPFTVPII